MERRGTVPGRRPDVVARPNYATVERTICERNAELCDRHGAHHVAVSKKRRRGRRQPETCITFYVARKGDRVEAEQVPKAIDLIYGGRGAARHSGGRAVVTDVREMEGRPVGFAMRGGHVVTDRNGAPGTVGLVFRRDGSDFFLTNAHVATDPGAPPGRMRVTVPGVGVEFGEVRVFDRLDEAVIRSDAALVEVRAGSVAPGEFRGVELALRGCGEIAHNDQRRFFYVARQANGSAGFVHEARWRDFVPAATGIEVDGVPLAYAGFHVLDLVVGQCGPGHSGAVVFRREGAGLQAMGLLFGGIVETNEVWVFPVRRSLDRMGVNPDSL